MALLSVAEVRGHVESDLTDDAVQRLLDAVESEINRKLGLPTSQTEILDGGSRYLHLARKASAIVSASEYYSIEGVGYSTISLATDDYSLLSDGRRLERLVDGTNAASSWLGRVTVAYTPEDSTAERKMLQVKLVKLDLKYEGLAADSVGDARSQYVADHASEKASLFRSLGGAGRLIT